MSERAAGERLAESEYPRALWVMRHANVRTGIPALAVLRRFAPCHDGVLEPSGATQSVRDNHRWSRVERQLNVG
ncbi:MAG: hypothetical protein KDI69_01295 [Xanthomonadales bacterium]|jgi:hypothetical protein|nr:hypothetical protein [Xanthomonadales bacterium]